MYTFAQKLNESIKNWMGKKYKLFIVLPNKNWLDTDFFVWNFLHEWMKRMMHEKRCVRMSDHFCTDGLQWNKTSMLISQKVGGCWIHSVCLSIVFCAQLRFELLRLKFYSFINTMKLLSSCEGLRQSSGWLLKCAIS